MSTLILVFHPHLKDGSRANARLLAELAAQGEDDIIVRDEYAEYPNFSVNADTEHELQGTATIGDAELNQAAADYVSAILD